MRLGTRRWLYASGSCQDRFRFRQGGGLVLGRSVESSREVIARHHGLRGKINREPPKPLSEAQHLVLYHVGYTPVWMCTSSVLLKHTCSNLEGASLHRSFPRSSPARHVFPSQFTTTPTTPPSPMGFGGMGWDVGLHASCKLQGTGSFFGPSRRI